MSLPILYSYRRCPYAMRARMALKVAGVDVEIREISLREKPKHLLAASPKGTVPVLVLTDGTVIDESLDIMQWALQRQDAQNWLAADATQVQALIAENDSSFKDALQAYKYPERYPTTQIEARAKGEVFFAKLEAMLDANTYLLKPTISLADVALMPFVRQFAHVDRDWFDQSPYPKLRFWLDTWLESDTFTSVMQKHPTYLD